jgi:hypothetical protein
MQPARQLETKQLYVRHAAATERGGWSALNDIRWGAIDVRRAAAQPEILGQLRRLTLELARRGAGAARAIADLAADPHAAAALTLELWDGLKHLHVLRSYLDSVDHAPRISDEEIAAARAGGASSGAEVLATSSGTEQLLDLLRTQHIASTVLRQLGARCEEPVLAELLSFMAADEARRAQLTADVIALRMRSGESGVTEVRAALQVVSNRARADAAVVHDLGVRTFVRRVESLCAELAQS